MLLLYFASMRMMLWGIKCEYCVSDCDILLLGFNTVSLSH